MFRASVLDSEESNYATRLCGCKHPFGNTTVVKRP